jgi:hypothetical protein
MLHERGVLPFNITEQRIDFWIARDAKDQEEAPSPGYPRPNPMFFGGGH